MDLYFGRRCSNNPTEEEAVAPNPSPSRFDIEWVEEYANAHVLSVTYLDCTNFEGRKILVYEGDFVELAKRDPHFAIGYSPIARFKPTEKGIEMAIGFAKGLGGG